MDYLHYLDLFDMWDAEEETVGRQRKVCQERQDPFLLSEEDFKSKHWFTKDRANRHPSRSVVGYPRYIHKIVNLIKDDIVRDKRGCGVSPELQVLTVVRSWARQEVQDDAADLHGLRQQTNTNIPPCSDSLGQQSNGLKKLV